MGGIIFLVALKKIKEVNDPRLKEMLSKAHSVAPVAFGNEVPENDNTVSVARVDTTPLAFGAASTPQSMPATILSVIRPPVEVILDPTDNSNVKILDENRNETEFEQIKVVNLSGMRYAVLRSCSDYNGMPGGSLIVFEIKSVLGTEVLSQIKDQACVDEILATEV